MSRFDVFQQTRHSACLRSQLVKEIRNSSRNERVEQGTKRNHEKQRATTNVVHVLSIVQTNVCVVVGFCVFRERLRKGRKVKEWKRLKYFTSTVFSSSSYASGWVTGTITVGVCYGD